MSAEKKAQVRAERNEKRRQEEQKDRRSMAVYTVVAVVVVVAAIAAMFWRSGILQRTVTALDVNGTKYTAADVQYYYRSIYNEFSQQYAFNTGASVKKQVYDETTGQTWYDYLMELAVERLTWNTALARQAGDEGYTLSQETQAEVDATLAQLETAWIGYGTYSSRDAFIRDRFGANMTYDRLVQLISMEYLASDYASSKLEDIEHSDADYDAYYREHADQMDTVTYSQITFRASVPTTHDQGETSATAEDPAELLETLKTEQKALADEVQAKLEAGADMEDLVQEYGDRAYGSGSSSRATYTDLGYFPYGDWLLDGARKAGDITVIENGSGSSYYYYVIRFEGRELDQEQTHTVRHLLVRAGQASISATPTQEEYDAAEEKAQSLLDEWKAGEATEDSFAALAAEHSDDNGSGGSAQNGGLISNITSTSSYVEAFRDWAVDPARKEGDTGLVKTEYGWHVMYYVSTNDPIWRQNTTIALQNRDYEELAEAASQGWTITRGMGMNFISA